MRFFNFNFFDIILLINKNFKIGVNLFGTSANISTDNSYIKYSISINQNCQKVSNTTSNPMVSVRFFRINIGIRHK
jgi:hypothetical protein